jgi:hypothetical protein
MELAEVKDREKAARSDIEDLATFLFPLSTFVTIVRVGLT